MLERHSREIDEAVAAIQARPICTPRANLRDLPTDWHELLPTPRQITNGSKR
jgi:hypothetical protein